jgi:hypothetical protein
VILQAFDAVSGSRLWLARSARRVGTVAASTQAAYSLRSREEDYGEDLWVTPLKRPEGDRVCRGVTLGYGTELIPAGDAMLVKTSTGVACVGPDGACRWKHAGEMAAKGVSADGCVYLFSGGQLCSVRANSGQKQWEVKAPGNLPAVAVASGRVFVPGVWTGSDKPFGGKKEMNEVEYAKTLTKGVAMEFGSVALVALDGGTGGEAWKVEEGGERIAGLGDVAVTCHFLSRLNLMEHDNLFKGGDVVRVFDAKDGSLLWEREFDGHVSTPVLSGDRMIFAVSTYAAPAMRFFGGPMGASMEEFKGPHRYRLVAVAAR